MTQSSKDNSSLITVSNIPDAVKVQKYSNPDWGTVGYSIPRDVLKRNIPISDLIGNTGIYFLVDRTSIPQRIYVGQSKTTNGNESILHRIRQHDSASKEKEWYCNLWDEVFAVTSSSNSWTEDDASTLERLFFRAIPNDARLNGIEPRGNLSRDCKDKFNQITAYLSFFGLESFEASDSITYTFQSMPYVESEYADKVDHKNDIQKGTSSIPEIITPPKTVQDMVNELPDSVCNSKTRFLDPACKSG